MWSWLIIILITLSCLFCFYSIAQMELKKANAKKWIILTCITIAITVGTLFSVPSPILQNYSFEPKPAEIKLKELKEYEEQSIPTQTTEGELQEETIDGDQTEDISQSTESPATGSEAEETSAEETAQEKKLMVVVPELNVRLDSNNNAEVIDTVQYGQILTEIEAPGDSDWVKVKMDSGLTGWVAKRYLNNLTE